MLSEISVVIQGAIDKNITFYVLHSIRKLFPNGEVILSTWEGSDVSGLNFDKVVFSKDPGYVILDEVGNVPNNINRQIVSTRKGLEQASNPYCLKIRTDVLLENIDFLNEFNKWDKIAPPLHVKNRILICNYYTRNPRIYPLPFHPSDWVLFGTTEDLRKYFSAPLEHESEIQWFKTHKREQTGFYTNLLTRYTPEQYICINFLRRFEKVDFDCFYDASKDNIIQTERMLAENFVVLDYQKQFGINFTKYNPNRYLEKSSLISHKYWKQLFNEYCLGKQRRYYWRILYCFTIKSVFTLRRMVLRLLHKLRLKEKVKRILNRKA